MNPSYGEKFDEYKIIGLTKLEARAKLIRENKEFGEKMGIGTRMLLQAKSLEFRHPITRTKVLVEAPTDPCIKDLAKI